MTTNQLDLNNVAVSSLPLIFFTSSFYSLLFKVYESFFYHCAYHLQVWRVPYSNSKNIQYQILVMPKIIWSTCFIAFCFCLFFLFMRVYLYANQVIISMQLLYLQILSPRNYPSIIKLTFQPASSFEIFLISYLSSHNEDKDGDQNTDSSCD